MQVFFLSCRQQGIHFLFSQVQLCYIGLVLQTIQEFPKCPLDNWEYFIDSKLVSVKLWSTAAAFSNLIAFDMSLI